MAPGTPASCTSPNPNGIRGYREESKSSVGPSKFLTLHVPQAHHHRPHPISNLSFPYPESSALSTLAPLPLPHDAKQEPTGPVSQSLIQGDIPGKPPPRWPFFPSRDLLYADSMALVLRQGGRCAVYYPYKPASFFLSLPFKRAFLFD